MYWVNTSSNTLINKVLKEASSSIFEELSKLFQRETINKTIDVYSNFNELKNTEQIWYLLTNAGYLTPVEEIDFGKYSIRIPNEEVHYFFERDFIRNFLGSVDNFDRTLSYLLEGAKLKSCAETVVRINQRINAVYVPSVPCIVRILQRISVPLKQNLHMYVMVAASFPNAPY